MYLIKRLRCRSRLLEDVPVVNERIHVCFFRIFDERKETIGIPIGII